jgi:hypothetical protein
MIGGLLPTLRNAIGGRHLAIIGAADEMVVDQQLVLLDAARGHLSPRDETLGAQKSQGNA